MKRIPLFLLCLVLVFFIAACGGGEEEAESGSMLEEIGEGEGQVDIIA
jgi:hypothetical protein